jgi:Tfp pilus assembly protein PilF
MSSRLAALLDFYDKDPSDPFILYAIALEYVSAGDYEKGENFFMMLLDKHPDYVPAYMQYAQLKEKQNKTEEAKQIYKQGIETARKAGDKHALNEMEAFLDELE